MCACCRYSIFALLLLAFECRFASMEPTIRQYFGFLFTYRGRAAFLFLYVYHPATCGLALTRHSHVWLTMCDCAYA